MQPELWNEHWDSSHDGGDMVFSKRLRSIKLSACRNGRCLNRNLALATWRAQVSTVRFVSRPRDPRTAAYAVLSSLPVSLQRYIR